jgi:hypothetical protein
MYPYKYEDNLAPLSVQCEVNSNRRNLQTQQYFPKNGLHSMCFQTITLYIFCRPLMMRFETVFVLGKVYC